MNTLTPIARLLAGIAFAAGLSSAALAQTDPSQPAARADVKAEARAANKAGIPAGEESDKQKPITSTKTRAERKAETREAAKEGKLPPPGEAEPGKK